MAERAKSIVRDLDPTNQLTFFRMKSESHEVERSFKLLFKFYFDFFLIPVYRWSILGVSGSRGKFHHLGSSAI